MRNFSVLAALALILGIPFVLRPKDNLLARADDALVIVTPHNEAIRHEFTHAFAAYYEARTGRTIRIDWRIPGGTSEIARHLKGEYFAAFEKFWRDGGHPWTAGDAAQFDNPKGKGAAREAFLASNVGIKVDLFFGGGAFDFIQQADAGRLVDSGVVAAHPDWFNENSIPQSVSGEPFYDAKGRWIGTVLSSFGICYNPDSLRRLGIEKSPTAWMDLGDPRYLRQVALADPTKSGSAAKAFEMIIQEQMQEVGGDAALAEGWERGLKVIQRASANARYFTDAALRVPVDVSLGDATIGMTIDFYGRYQSEAVRIGDEPSRLQYFTPVGGSSVGVDPIALLRGAPNREAAVMFIDFVLSLEGQKLWNFKVGTPGGPVRYSLRRLPIRKELYAPDYVAFRADPGVFPYEEARLFTYHPAWTAALFKTISFVIRIACLDCHDEQVAAWKALIQAGFPPRAMEAFADMTAVSYSIAKDQIRPALSSANRIAEVELARELGEKFREQYRRARDLAEEGK